MIPISRSTLLAAGLLACPMVVAMAQQTNDSGNAATLKSTTPGAATDARSAATSSGSAGGAAPGTTTMGDVGKKTEMPSGASSSSALPPGVPSNQQPRPQH